ncbi:MAG: nucleoside transporter C-terminal domain-containing protein, partial [Planctomycetota bacterium]
KEGSDGPVRASIKVGNRSLGRERSYRVATNDYLAYGGDGWTQFGRGQGPRSIGREVYEVTVEGIRGENLADSITAALRASSFEQTGNLRQRWVSLLGLLVLVGLGYLLSIARNRIRLRPLLWGTILQVILALLILQTRPGRLVFDWAKAAFQKILDFSIQGSKFVFGPLADLGISGEIFGVENAFIFAFQVAGTIILVSSLTAILYHLGVMQAIVWVMAKVMQFTMRTSGAESLATAANVFIGQTEAPLVVRPYLAGMTASEIMALMTGGMATVAGGVLAAYVSFGIDAGHLLAASVMSAPAALALAKLMVPETEHSQTAADVPFEMRRTSANILDAACRGASDGLKLAINVMAMLIAFISLVHLVNFLLDGGYQIFHDRLTAGGTQPMKIPDHISLEGILGWILAPIAWLLGIPWREATEVGSLLGVKMVLNEFVAYLQLAGMSEKISPRSFGIATYALCGFANFSSIAIQIGGISALEQGIRPQLARHGLRAMLGGTLAARMTAALAGVLL